MTKEIALPKNNYDLNDKMKQAGAKIKIQYLIDIDGVIVESFSAKGLNNAQYTEKLAEAKLRFAIINELRVLDPDGFCTTFITGRNIHAHHLITQKQLQTAFPEWGLNVCYYPNHFDYDMGLYRMWKLIKYLEACNARKYVAYEIWEDDQQLCDMLDLHLAHLKLGNVTVRRILP
jgi:hypothetical protein